MDQAGQSTTSTSSSSYLSSPEVRRSSRMKNPMEGFPITRFLPKIVPFLPVFMREPQTFSEAVGRWQQAMTDSLQALEKNGTDT